MSSTYPFAAREGWRRGAPHEPDNGVPPAPDEDGGAVAEEDTTLEVLKQNQRLLAAILKELQEQVQQGIVIGMPLTVNTRAADEVTFDPALFAIGITCDGPAAFEYRIPNRTGAPWVQINPGEVVNFTYVKGVVSSLGVRTLPALGVSNYRLLGIF